MTMRKLKTALGITLSCGWFLCATARADISCSGPGGVILYADGTVMIDASWRNDWTMICNTQNGFGVSTPPRARLYGAAVKSSQSHVNVATYYSGDTYMCANIPTYHSAPPPVYLLTAAT